MVVGYGSGALAVIDPGTRKVVARLALPAHPESFRLDGDRVFVNTPNARGIIVGNLADGRTETSWAAAYAWNFPMAFDAASNTLAIVYRLPARLQVLNAGSGAVTADTATCGDADDVFFDASRRRLYVICGSGAIDVLAAAHYDRVGRVATQPGARTGMFAPELDRLFVAVRARPGASAAIWVYRPRP